MPVTTQEQEYKRLRSYLNPAIKGPNTDAILNALAAGSSSYLINNVAAVNDNLYIATAVDIYLDQRLADAQIVRPANVGLSDDVFRQIGIEVKNRKQVRDLINNLLDSIFGDEFVRALSKSAAIEPYSLVDGDQLLISFDNQTAIPVTFVTGDFQNIASAKAQEVADAITKNLRSLGFTGTAIAKNDGNGGYVELLSDTVGPRSSVTVFGGRAQNELLFNSAVPAGGNMSTQWTLSLQSGGVIRFTWSGGANPNLGKVASGNYVNVFGGGFASSPNEGSFIILNSVGGVINQSYFEVSDPLGTSGIVTQGSDDAVLFYNPVRNTLASQHSFAAVYQTQNSILQIFLPAATQVIRRNRIGSAHLHYPPSGNFSFSANAISGDQFSITSTLTLTAGVDFAIGASISATIAHLVTAISGVSGLVAYAGNNTLTIMNDLATITLTCNYTGGAAIIGSGPLGDNTSLAPSQQGPYMFDLAQPFTVGSIGTTLNEVLDGTSSRVVNVVNASRFPDQQGYLIFDYGTQNQEGPVPYIARPSSNTLLISPAYTIQKQHLLGSNVSVISLKAPASITTDGTDYPFYITDVVSGRIYAQNLINSIAATGITIIFTILYPSDVGLGKWGTVYTENPIIWGT